MYFTDADGKVKHFSHLNLMHFAIFAYIIKKPHWLTSSHNKQKYETVSLEMQMSQIESILIKMHN